ncbi:MAG: SpoIIE family protein phosphatase [Solobacterium sp.]|nr:SpoIIE family protein phosphatase [Solobacterium sp.]
MKKKRKTSIIIQVTVLFLAGVIATGFLSYFTQYRNASGSVQAQTENRARMVASEVRMALNEYPAYEWLAKYWRDNAESLEIEYDVSYATGRKTKEKCLRLEAAHPGMDLRYLTEREIMMMPKEDRKCYAEIAYSWLINRINQIKRSQEIDYLFCVITDSSYKTQFFLFSAADANSKRGTNYEEVYTLGTTVTVNESQEEAMRHARMFNSHLAEAGNYVDYYAYLMDVGRETALIGLTFNVSALKKSITSSALSQIEFSALYQLFLFALCLMTVYLAVLKPLKAVQADIRLYKNTKDSNKAVTALQSIRAYNEIGTLSEDMISLIREIDDYIKRIENITIEKERITAELTLATKIQSDVLPNIFPAFPERNEFDIYALMDPAREVGGDFYDFFLIDDDHLCVIVADVSGKGIPAALFMMSAKIILDNNAMMGKSPAEIMRDTNTAVCAGNQEEMFITVWLGILEISTGKLTACNAGHEYPAMKKKGGRFEMLRDKHCFVVGGVPDAVYREYEIQMEPGDSLFLYSDGLPEAMDRDKQLFTTDRMIDALNAYPDVSPMVLLEKVSWAVSDFVKDSTQYDDLTMLCLAYAGPQNTITVDADLKNLAAVTDFVSGKLEAMDVPPKAVMQTDVVIDEIFSNIAKYAYGDKAGKASVTVREEEDGFQLIFEDHGVPFDPTQQKEPDLTLPAEEREIGGLGITMVRKMMDGLSYEYLDGKNILTVTKKCK